MTAALSYSFMLFNNTEQHIILYAYPGNPRRVPRHVIVHLYANKYI